eukprot:m.88697 g.88697  ORF g.88697 m.88697 type:complete len:173 (-) comp13182_c0_seq1:1577-2095(-)
MGSHHILKCQIGLGDGLDVGEGIRGDGCKYLYEGDVRNKKANGIGVKTYESGFVLYGHFKDGKLCGDWIWKRHAGMDFTEYNQGHILRIIKYDDSNPRHTGLLHQVLARAESVRSLLAKPWSRSTHCYNKFRQFDPVIMTILLCAERLRRQDWKELHPLPCEIVEMILSFAF